MLKRRSMELHDTFMAAVCEWAMERSYAMRGGDSM